MIPVFCQTKHDPDNGTFGDCVRACVASIMEFGPDRVPHFFHDNPSPIIANQRMRDWLAHYGFAAFFVSGDGSETIDAILNFMGKQNPTAYYMLYGRTEGGDHVVVCRGGEITHDPAWYSSPLIGCGSNGVWSIMAIARS